MATGKGSISPPQRQSKLLFFLLFTFVANRFSVHAFSLSMVERGTVVVAGATGYIGKSTVRESVRQGYKTVALVRNLKKVQSEQGQRLYGEFFKNAEVIECDVADPQQLEKVGTMRQPPILTIIQMILRNTHIQFFTLCRFVDNEGNPI